MELLLWWMELAQETASVVDRLEQRTSSVVVVYAYVLRIRKVINLLLLKEEGSYMPDMDAGVEAELADSCNYMICTSLIYCNGRDC